FYHEDAVRQDQSYKGFTDGTIRNKKGYNGRIDDTTMSTYLVNKVIIVSDWIKTPVDMLRVIKLWRLDDVTSKKAQTQNLLYYHPTRDREQHSTWKLFSYREDSNEAAFAGAAVEKIYAHESLTFNNIVACEVIFKWNAGLKDDMDARSDVYVLSNGYKKCSDDSDGYYWEYTPDMFIHLFLYIDDMG
nr:zinc finger, CCHC-type [Tanacetum cinerariifolium]